MITVYYHVPKFEGMTMLALTEKTYWDKNHILDDGTGARFQDIADAMRDVYMDEMSESTWELESPDDIPGIVAKMREHGFDMQTNPAFSSFLDGHI